MYNTRKVNTTTLLMLPALALLIGVLVSWWLGSDWDWLPAGLDKLGWIALIVNGGLAVSPWLLRIGRRIDLFKPVYFVTILFLLVFFLRPIQILYDTDARSEFMPDDAQLFQQALFLGALGLICFYIGYGSKIGILVERKLPRFGGQWRHKRVVQVAIIYTLLGMAGYSFAVARSGGLGTFLYTLRGRGLLEEQGGWIFASTLVLVQVATIMLGTYYFKTRRLGVFFITILALAVGSGLLLGGRSTVLVILLTLLVIFFYLRNPRPGRFLVNAMVLGAFAAVAIAFAVILRALRLYALRGGDVGVILSPSDLAIGNFGAVFVNDFNQFDWFAIMLDIVPDRIPFQYGETFLEFFAMFVPRALWPGKPLPIGFVISMALGGPRAGKPSTILGELYLNFHVPGIMVGMVIFGILARAVYAYLQDNWGNPAAILLYAYTFASLHQFFTRTFAPRMFGFVLFIIPTILALRYVQRRKA